MLREFTCILCPNGCVIEAEIENGQIAELHGQGCKRGRTYVEQELLCPTRNIASSVRIDGGTLPLCSVRLSKPVPKDRIWDVMGEIKKQRITAPAHIGDVVIRDVAGTGSDVIVTKPVGREE